MAAEDLVFDLFDDPLQFTGLNGSLVAGPFEAIEHLGAIPGDAAAVLLDDGQFDLIFDALVGGEALAAMKALPAPADCPPALTGTRVDHLQAFLIRVAERAAHWPPIYRRGT